MNTPATAAAIAAMGREPGQVVSPDYLRYGTLRYGAHEREIVGRNGPHFNNRPLYCAQNTEGAVLAGDRPLARLIARPLVHGALAVGFMRGPQAKWLYDFADIESRYRCGRMTWRCTDPLFPRTEFTFTVLPLHGEPGLVARLRIAGAQPDDTVVWAFGGAQADDDPRITWDPIMGGNPHICRSGDQRRALLAIGLQAEAARGNVATLAPLGFTLAAAADASHHAVGGVERGGVFLGDGSALADPGAFRHSTAGALPFVGGTAPFSARDTELLWMIKASAAREPLPASHRPDLAEMFRASEACLHRLETVVLDTPDPQLDAAMASVAHAIDGACEQNPAIFRHGAMAYNIRFVGWRVICGATALGWHDRVRENAAFYLGQQRTSSEGRMQPSTSARLLGTHEEHDSRYYGRGQFPRTAYEVYDVQGQFFDQTIRDWRADPDPALEAQLRSSLEVHTEWLRECFDPDDDGLYESYINTLPTDSVWYDGGGSVEASAYAHVAHRAARDIARRAGDAPAAARHEAQLEKIARALREHLWLPARGHFGAYREQAGHRRVHSDAWTYSVYLPIDAGIATPEEALQSLYYTEWALERIRLPFGGELCQLSNWVPWKWSVREMFGGDICGLALGYFQTGLGSAGYELLRGAMLESAYASVVPGGLSHIGAGTDFGDNVHMFARTVVEGLFGFAPDYPNGVVSLRPAFPASWPRASITTPDFTFAYRQTDEADTCHITLARPAALELRLSVRAHALRRVTLDDREIPFVVEPGYSCTWVTLRLEQFTGGRVTLELANRSADSAPLSSEAEAGQGIALTATHGEIVRWRDLHEVLLTPQLAGPTLRARVAAKPGHHLVLLECRCGELPRWQICQLHVTDSPAAQRWADATPRSPAPDATWTCLDLAPHYNGDIRTIFQQQYLHPRPATCSVRLGTDGYSAWTFVYWHLKPPPIALNHLAALTDSHGRIATPPGVPFTSFAAERNVAFTSRWDNWPTVVEIPVARCAHVAWVLVAGSTFPMQTRIANAELRFRYADGVVEKLELIPPLNFWILCPWGGEDYSYAHDAFCLPPEPPPQVQLGDNCRAMVLAWKLRPTVPLVSVTLETLSSDVVIGLLGLTLEHHAPAD